jgi:hypothetical protein
MWIRLSGVNRRTKGGRIRETAEMCFLRVVARYRQMDRKCTKYITEELGTTGMNIVLETLSNEMTETFVRNG